MPVFKYIFCAFIFFFAVFSAPANLLAQTAVNPNDKTYLEMIAQSKAMKEDFDFAAVRAIYPRTSFFNPYEVTPNVDVPALFKAVQTGNPAALQKLEEYKQNNFPLIEMHAGYNNYYKAFKKTGLAAYHDWAASGFIRGLLKTGDGRSAETAYKILNIGEEYMLAKNGFLDVRGQRIENKDGRVYDVLEGFNTVFGKKAEMWFDITDIFRYSPP